MTENTRQTLTALLILAIGIAVLVAVLVGP